MINDISLYQFKNYAEEVTIPFSALNIIYGSNGKGKSTMLQALMLLSQTLRAEDKLQHLRINGEFVSLDRFEDILCSYAETSEEEIHISLHSGSDYIETIFTKGQLPQRANLKALRVNGMDYVTENASDKTEENGCVDEADEIGYSIHSISDVAGLQQIKSMYYVSADRRGPINGIKRDDNVNPDCVGVNGEFSIQVLYHHPELLSQLEDALSTIFKGASIRLPSDSNDDDLKLLLDSSDSSKGYKPTNVGFGYSHVLPIIIQVLLAKPNSIVILENPEAHLHPRGQAEIGKLIAETVARGVQVFVETHSDHVINGIRVAVKKCIVKPEDVNIAFFERSPHNVVADDGATRDEIYSEVRNIKVGADGSLSEYPTDFMDEWSIQQLRLFSGRKV